MNKTTWTPTIGEPIRVYWRNEYGRDRWSEGRLVSIDANEWRIRWLPGTYSEGELMPRGEAVPAHGVTGWEPLPNQV